MRIMTLTYQSEIGPLTLIENHGAITQCRFAEALPKAEEGPVSPLLQEASRQIGEYFQGQRNVFELPLAPVGTAFQEKVWAALQNIPYGETWSYQQLAESIGKPQASRAVGSANAKNPLWILIPCHRVIHASGDLGGYAGGLDVKAKLLNLEKKWR